MLLVKLFGPVQLHVGVPEAVVLADKLNVEPLHNADCGDTVGAAGADGAVNAVLIEFD